MKVISVIIPAYNEERLLRQTLAEVKQYHDGKATKHSQWWLTLTDNLGKLANRMTQGSPASQQSGASIFDVRKSTKTSNSGDEVHSETASL